MCVCVDVATSVKLHFLFVTQQPPSPLTISFSLAHSRTGLVAFRVAYVAGKTNHDQALAEDYIYSTYMHLLSSPKEMYLL